LNAAAFCLDRIARIWCERIELFERQAQQAFDSRARSLQLTRDTNI
jgi:hypothetical protein